MRLPMGHVSSNRKLAEALLKTLKRLESDPSIDSADPSFVHLKCKLLQRLMGLELDTAEIQSSIHLVDSQDSQPDEPAKLDEKCGHRMIFTISQSPPKHP